ncbi:hypothetical protein H6G74_22610 [Nostoc spongiaeforme FACHB-130]|uniref:Uncharacterized protein n=1 Tax=Nostoc spongiaeforme FACHB-130 TaxID=1357510 RepID=A0ABR8G1I9_9NOSO|nr:hypothetical protein [Nostoc spongiaeforme]MBD2597095.1 hypothetical protein [Nostoc spongiaeforme FACHB-130]
MNYTLHLPPTDQSINYKGQRLLPNHETGEYAKLAEVAFDYFRQAPSRNFSARAIGLEIIKITVPSVIKKVFIDIRRIFGGKYVGAYR